MATEIHIHKRGAAILLVAAALSVPSTANALAADEGRFDARVFRPLAAPHDLVMVPKTEVIGHLSPVLGLYWDAALNVRAIGTEGKVKQTPTLGDVRISSKVAIPSLNRKEEVKSGFGLAAMGDINLPTGDELAFTSDGALSGGVSIIVDYRFNFGLLLAANMGVWLRPEHPFAGVKVGDMAQFGVACGFGAPAIRVFNSVTWQPKSSAEQHEINRRQDRDSVLGKPNTLLPSESNLPNGGDVLPTGGSNLPRK